MQLRLNEFMENLAFRVKSRRKELGLTQDQVAKDAGLKQSDVSKIELGLIQKTTNLVGLARALKCRPEWLDDGSGDAFDLSDFAGLPTMPVTVKYAFVHGVIQGGDSGFIDCVGVTEQDPEPVAYVAHLKDEQAYAVRVRGSSMEPAIMPGWYVIASPARPAQPPDLCVVYFADERKALKRLLWQRDGTTCLESIHKDHAKMMEPDSNIVRMDKVISIVPN